MNIEYEATFTNIDKEELRKKLGEVGAQLIKPEFLQRRVNFHLPEKHQEKYAWVRVRDEQDKIMMSYKKILGEKLKTNRR